MILFKIKEKRKIYKMKKRKSLIIFVILLSIILIDHSFMKADEVQPMGGYTVEGIPHDNQINKNVNYFYLYEQPSDEDEIKIKLENTSSHDKQLTIKVTDGNTNINGEVDYTGTLKNHSSLTNPLTSILKPEQSEINVPSNSTVETSLKLKMPPKNLSGIILGAIRVSEAKNKNELKGMMNTYSYTLGVVLTNSKNSELNKNLSLKLENVSAKLFEGKKVVEADILNASPYIFSNSDISGVIKEKKSGKVIQKTSKNNICIAPNSVFPFQFDWKNKNLRPGTYVFSSQIKDSTRIWKLEKEFTITAERSKEINKHSIYKIYIPLWLKIAEILSFLITIGLTYWNFKILKGKSNV